MADILKFECPNTGHLYETDESGTEVSFGDGWGGVYACGVCECEMFTISIDGDVACVQCGTVIALIVSEDNAN